MFYLNSGDYPHILGHQYEITQIMDLIKFDIITSSVTIINIDAVIIENNQYDTK